MTAHLEIKIFGRVQGVWFRRSAQEQARSLGLCGYARNVSDDSVHIEVEGDKDKLGRFLSWCEKGPAVARVADIRFKYSQELTGYKNFEVR